MPMNTKAMLPVMWILSKPKTMSGAPTSPVQKRGDEQKRRKPIVSGRSAHVGEVVRQIANDAHDLNSVVEHDCEERPDVKPDRIVDGLGETDISVEEPYHNERYHCLAANGQPLGNALHHSEDDCLYEL